MISRQPWTRSGAVQPGNSSLHHTTCTWKHSAMWGAGFSYATGFGATCGYKRDDSPSCARSRDARNSTRRVLRLVNPGSCLKLCNKPRSMSCLCSMMFLYFLLIFLHPRVPTVSPGFSHQKIEGILCPKSPKVCSRCSRWERQCAVATTEKRCFQKRPFRLSAARWSYPRWRSTLI